MKQRFYVMILSGAFFGAALSLVYVNPFEGNIILSELILQLSGSRGEFALGLSFVELLALSMKFAPYFIVQMYTGTELYQHFCTASIYIFSRTPDRRRWYRNEVFLLGQFTLVYQLIIVVTAIITTLFRYQVQMNFLGIILTIYHIVLYVIWIYTMTLLINVIAIKLGSSTAFFIMSGTQIVLITLLGLINMFIENLTLAIIVLMLNPIAHLVLGWQVAQPNTGNEFFDHILDLTDAIFNLPISLILLVIFAVIVTMIGAFIIERHDLLFSNTETEVM